MDIAQLIAAELGVHKQQVLSVIDLLADGATVPFIARYRKEVTGGLDDTVLRRLEERLVYLREFAERKTVILKSIADQGKLTDELQKAIDAVITKAELEDIYLPYKPKRRTKAQIAREAGLQPLADQLLTDIEHAPLVLAATMLNPEKEIDTPEKALDGARQILMEQFAEDAHVTKYCREYLWAHAIIKSSCSQQQNDAAQKFRDYFEYEEPLKKIPSHRALALFRGRQLEILQLEMVLTETEHEHCQYQLREQFLTQFSGQQKETQQWLLKTIELTWKIKLLTRLEIDNLMRLREMAEEEAIKVFAKNCRDLLMASPAGARVTMGLDPGFRTGVKVVVIDETGKLLTYTAIYPHQPQQQWRESLQILHKLCAAFKVNLISIGNGTASRETDKLVSELMKQHPELGLIKIMVSEAGASVYSASELAAKEFPDLDVVYRGAVSIARRLQDPLAELVKIDPKAIGVGQYQHDVNQTHLARSLVAVMEDCVNSVGVDINRASVPLLAKVSGLNQTLAQNIVEFRNQHGAFKNRDLLKKVPRLGDKTFQQAAGFLRITDGDNPLDASAVHPEAYPVVMNILEAHQWRIDQVIGNAQNLGEIKPQRFVSEQFGLPTVNDIIQELAKPGRDPRPEFKYADLKEGIEKISDLKIGMILEGTVTNVTHFGAFVDIGVHQDGLVHKSQMAERYVEDPSEVVKVGMIVKVKVVEIDEARKRIGLSLRLNETIRPGDAEGERKARPMNVRQKTKLTSVAPANSSMADAFKAALRRN